MAKGLVSALVASSKAIDPTLDALFSQSAGAVKTPPKSRYAELLPRKASPPADEDEEDEDEDEELSEVTDASEDESEEESGAKINAGNSSDDDDDMAEEDGSEDEDNGDASSGDDEAEAAEVLERAASRKTAQDEGRKRKRKQRDDDEDLEANYLERLANEEEPSGKRRKGDSGPKAEGPETAKDGEASSAEKEDDESGGDVPVHESLAAGPAASELEKANRTVFLSNVSVEAITSRKAKKTLLNHLSSVLDKKADPPQKVQSIRFRSTAFETAGIPKRAAYIKKSVMEATTKSTNAYVVYSTNAAARLAVSQLNGTVVLDRHLRVDSVAHPAPVDHRRCVFVGNLGFVDDETVYNTKLNEEGKEVTEKRKRTKTPMDVEEGLWRVFCEKAGKVESVRVVRDPATRVGKGIAYVQFYDGNAVESAILLNGKKFPPMLPRELRVSRCKAPHKTARAMEARRERTAALSGAADRKGGKKGKKTDDGDSAKYVPKPTAEAQTLAGRASKLLGRFGAAQLVGKPPGKDKKHRDRRNRGMNRDGNRSGSGGPAAAGAGGGVGEKSGFKAPEQFVFEGRRASARDGKPKDLKFKTKGKGKGKDKVHKKKKAGKAGK